MLRVQTGRRHLPPGSGRQQRAHAASGAALTSTTSTGRARISSSSASVSMLPSGLLGEVRNTILGLCSATARLMPAWGTRRGGAGQTGGRGLRCAVAGPRRSGRHAHLALQLNCACPPPCGAGGAPRGGGHAHTGCRAPPPAPPTLNINLEAVQARHRHHARVVHRSVKHIPAQERASSRGKVKRAPVDWRRREQRGKHRCWPAASCPRAGTGLLATRAGGAGCPAAAWPRLASSCQHKGEKKLGSTGPPKPPTSWTPSPPTW